MMMNKVVIVSGDDWSGLYVNGKLETEDHQIRQHDFINLIEKYRCFESVDVVEIDDYRLEELGGCPMSLEDIG